MNNYENEKKFLQGSYSRLVNIAGIKIRAKEMQGKCKANLLSIQNLYFTMLSHF